MAERLIEKETIDNEELRQIIEANSPNVMIVPGTTDAAARRTADESPAADSKKAKLAERFARLAAARTPPARSPSIAGHCIVIKLLVRGVTRQTRIRVARDRRSVDGHPSHNLVALHGRF